jgi:hypothetical protein
VTTPPFHERVVFVATPPERRRPRWWLIAFTLVWVLVLAGGIAWSVQRGTPTAREQTTVAQAVPVVNVVTTQLVAAATADGLAAAAISGLERADCSVTVFRSGARYQRVVTAAVATGTELALLRRVAERLPPSYKAAVTTATGPKLKADAGTFVAVTGTVAEPGRVRFVVDTGDCRPEGDVPAAGGSTERPRLAETVDDLFNRLRVRQASWTRNDLACPGSGDIISTLEVRGPQDELPDAIDAALGRPEGLIVATPDLYAYRHGQTDIVIWIDGSRLVASFTYRCVG